MESSLKVAVIGAGVAGLGTSRELKRQGHQVMVYEKASHLGGTWVYNPRVESDELGLNPNREIIHGSLYHTLRTNLPRVLMGFSDYPFEDKDYGDSRVFPGHQEVLRYLVDFADKFKLTELIRFNAEVVRVEQVDSSHEEWVVESKTSGQSSEEIFDAVVVCNGHYTQPQLANDIPGIEKWPRRQVHSHNYRVPEPFRDQVTERTSPSVHLQNDVYLFSRQDYIQSFWDGSNIVVMIGSGHSANDISKDVATLAKEVHLSSRSPDVKVSKLREYKNIWQHSKIAYITENGWVTFQDGCSIEADVIFHCTGYKYYYPFLKTNGVVSVEDNRVGPLYKHVFPPHLAPRLSFVALPIKTHLTRMVELQSKWIAQVWSGRVVLPSKEAMLADIEQLYRQNEKEGIPKHYTHSTHFKLDYLEWLAAQVGWPLDERVMEIYRRILRVFLSIRSGGGSIRDYEREFVNL